VKPGEIVQVEGHPQDRIVATPPPTVGRIVLYCEAIEVLIDRFHGGAESTVVIEWPAIVRRAYVTGCDLTVFDGSGATTRNGVGCSDHPDVPQVGRWRWTPRL